MNETDRAACLAWAQFLHATRQVAPLALGLAAVGLLVDARQGAWAAATLTVVLALAERALALRLVFDARLFTLLATGALPTLESLDRALHAIGLRSPAIEPRPLDERLQGTKRLLAQYLVVVAAQALLAAALWLP